MFDYWKGLLPEHIDAVAVDNLVGTLDEAIQDSPAIRDALEACNLQPTSRASWLASACAVMVLLSHELGQEVARDEARDEAAQP